MANQEHVKILKQGVEVWNTWREKNQEIVPNLNNVSFKGRDFRGINFFKTELIRADLSNTDLRGANISRARLNGTSLAEADLRGRTTNFFEAALVGADLREARLNSVYLSGADLRGANLTGAVLRDANLEWANMSRAILNNADLMGSYIYATSAWDVLLNNTNQQNLHIIVQDETPITVDNLRVAQFIYLLLDNKEIRYAIDTITSKVVLIIGSFTPKRKLVLEALRDELRTHNLSPVVFDFEPSATRDLTETISLLAHMSRFVIADLTDAKSLPQELEHIVPHLPSVPVQPLLQIGTTEYAMFEHYERYPWVLPIHRYQDIPSLITSIKEYIIEPVEEKANEKDKMKKLEEEVGMLKEKIKKLEKGK